MTTPRPQNGLTVAEMVRLRDAGVTFRQRGNPPKLDPEDLRRWYVDEGQSTVEIARRTGMSTTRFDLAWLRRLGIYELSGTIRYRPAHALR